MTLDNILEEINKAENIVILTHENPDGDAVGSSLAMYHALKAYGKNVEVIIPEYSRTFEFLPGANEIKNSVFYNRIEDRISYFERIFDMLDVNKSKIIVDYDKSIVSNSKLHNTKYILYREIKSSYLLLTIGDRGKGEYPETLLFEISKKYLTGQQLLDVIDIRIEC